MKLIKKLTTGFSGLALALVMLAGHSGVASAACNWNYTGQVMTTSSTPVFNSICGTPSFGDEDNFVRVGANSGGAATFSIGSYGTGDLSAVCNDGDRFNVLTYVHNDAEPQYNSGAGTGIAHNVQLTNSSPLGSNASSFNFSSRVSASNAASVFDNAKINCSGGPVTLSLVPSSVRLEREFTGGTISPIADSAANGAFTLSSDPANFGDFPGCWNYRVMVAYTVVVSKPAPTPSSATCDMLSIAALPNRTVRISGLNYSNSNATFNSVNVTWGDGTNATYNSIAAATAASHQYSKDGTYTVTAVMTFTGTNGVFTATSASCAKPVTFSNGGGTTPTPPTTLVNTGPGTTLGIFAAVTAFGAVAHRYFLGRRLTR